MVFRSTIIGLFCLGLLTAGCGNVPFLTKSPPPGGLDEPAYQTPPPLPAAPPPEPTAAPLAAPRPAPTPMGSTAVDSRLADLASQFEALRARLQVVEGKLAEQENQVQQLNQSGGPQQTQMRERLLALERDLAAVQERLLRVENQRLAPAPRAEPAPAPPIREVPPPPAVPKASGDPYQEGMSQYKQKSYAAARDHFQQFLRENPKGDKAHEARYYLADSLLQEKKYDEAIVEFNKVVEGNPKGAHAPAALLKQAQAFKAQGKSKVAGLVLEKLLAEYPKSPEAAQARKLQGAR